MFDVLYPVKEPGHHEELRFSLRSLQNIDHNQVFLAGYRPRWTANITHIPRQQNEKTEGKQDKFLRTWYNLKKGLEHPNISDSILIMNDDFYITRPLENIPIYRGREFTKANLERTQATLEIMSHIKCRSTYSYEYHTPFLVEKDKLLYIFREIEDYYENFALTYWRTIYGNYYRIGGQYEVDIKIWDKTQINENSQFLSTEDSTFREHARPYLESLFPSPSIYEK